MIGDEARPVSSVQCTREKRENCAEPSSGESAPSTYSTEPSRFTAFKSVLWLHNTTFATPAHRGAATTWSSHSASAADAALRVHKARSPHQTRSGSRYGQAGCLLHQGRPPGGWAVRLRSPPTTVPLRPDGRHRPLTPRASEVAHGLYQQSPAYQSRPTPRSDRSSAALLRRRA